MSASSLTAEEYERARTWMLEIAAAALPEGTTARDVGEERTFAHTGGLSINRRNGLWFCHAEGRGGCSAISLVRFAKDWDKADATAWVLAFLAAHPGTGGANGSTEDSDAGAAAGASRSQCEAILAAVVPIEGTPAEEYLRRRGLVPPYPVDCAGFVPYARVGEGALIGQLRAFDRTVGVQVTYLDHQGRKSLVLPLRRRFNLEKSPGAAFLLPSETSGSTLLCEGLEDALSLGVLGIGPVIGLPGAAGLRHLALPKGANVVVFRDGDVPGAAADKALIAGVDHLLLEGATVRVTATPAGQDANSILQSDGVEALLALINSAVPAALSLDGDIQRIARLGAADYERERHAVSKKHKARLGFIDDAAKAYRQAEEPPKDASSINDEPAWDGPIPVLADVLDAALKEVGRYIVASEAKRATAVLWATHTHIAHNEPVGLSISPRLAIQANTWGSGKTTLLEIVSVLSFRGTCRSSVTASSVMRSMHETKLTYCLDEADRQLAERDNRHDLMEILNSGHRRHSAFAERSVPTPDGGWKVVRFNVWGAIAFAGIGELPSTLQDRSVRILLQKATGAEVPEHLRDGSSRELVSLRRQLSAWADGLFELPEPELPAILMRQAGRVGDNWRPLISIADLAGRQWPALARQAALEEVAAEKSQTPLERLLAACLRVFNKQSDTLPAEAPDNRDRMRTATLIGALLNDHEDDWGVANRGRIITAAWLRDQLRGLLNPSGAQEWRTPEPARIHCRGYLRLQFADSWRRYVPEQDAQKNSSPEPSGTPGMAGTHGTAPQNSAGYEAEEAVPHAQTEDRMWDSDNMQKDQEFCGPVPDGPDIPGVPDDLEGGGNAKKRAKRTTKRTNGRATGGSPDLPLEDEEEDAGAATLDELIRAARTANPTRSIQWLAKHVGLSVDVVEPYFRDSPP